MFKNKVIAITGAGSGIGRALAINFARAGARLALADLHLSAVQQTADMLPAGSDARAYQLDVSQRDAVFAFSETVVADFGAVHYIFNNAGTSTLATFNDTTIEEIEKVINVNLWGVIYGTKAFLPIMLRQGEGCIVNTSSVFGLVATPCSSAYTMTKFAVRGLTETLWEELEGTGVSAVVIHPGGVDTAIKDVPPAQHEGELARRVKAANIAQMTMSPDECALQIIDGLRAGKRRLLVGNGAKAIFRLSRLFPDTYGRLMRKKLGI